MGGEAGSARGPALWQLAAGAVLASGAAAAFYWYRIMSPEERKRMHEQARRIVERGMAGGRLGGGEDVPAGVDDAPEAEAIESTAEGAQAAVAMEDYINEQLANQAPKGGDAGRYTWMQSESEVEVRVQVPKATKSKHVTCVFKTKAIKLSVATLGDGGSVLDGTTPASLDADECVWSFEDDGDRPEERTLVVTLVKTRPTWSANHWTRVCENEPEVVVQSGGGGPQILNVNESDPEAMMEALAMAQQSN